MPRESRRNSSGIGEGTGPMWYLVVCHRDNHLGLEEALEALMKSDNLGQTFLNRLWFVLGCSSPRYIPTANESVQPIPAKLLLTRRISGSHKLTHAETEPPTRDLSCFPPALQKFFVQKPLLPRKPSSFILRLLLQQPAL